jgi:hypothetical protein
MSLSLNKLERLLSTKGLLPKKYFVIHGNCVYIEVLSITNADSFLLYIPSKYQIAINSGNDVYKIESLELDEEGNIPVDYAREPDNFDLDQEYEDIDINETSNKENIKDLTKHLEENYNSPVSLKDIVKEDNKDLRDVFRQLRRFRFCVQSISYKLGIVFKNYICCIDRYNTLKCFIIKHYPNKNIRKLMVSLDIETFYDKINTISVDIQTVRIGVYKVLDKNQLKHTNNLKNMLETKSDITEYSNIIYSHKIQFAEYINQLETMLERLRESEKRVIEKIMKIDEKYSEHGIKGLHKDIEKTHILSKHETELERINTVKQDIIRNIIDVKIKQENIALSVDKIFFDNSVMLDAILKNMKTLKSLQF